MRPEEFEQLEFFQAVRSDAFKKISRRSMTQWRILMGIKPGRLDESTTRYLWRIAEYFGDDSEGLDQVRYLGIEPPEHADDIVDWIQNAPTFDELDTLRFQLNYYEPLRRKRVNPYESNLARLGNNRTRPRKT